MGLSNEALFLVFICFPLLLVFVLKKILDWREEKKSKKSEDNLSKLMKEAFSFDVKTYSPNNTASSMYFTEDEMENYAVDISNTKLNKQQIIKASTTFGLGEIIEEVFRLWAKQEKDSTYICTLQNYAISPPKQYRITQFVGISHREDSEYERYKNLVDGEKVLLVKEPSNPYDKNAIKVLTQDGYHIGYLARDYARNLNRSLNNFISYGWHYHYDEQNDLYNVIRIYRNYISYEKERDNFEYEV